MARTRSIKKSEYDQMAAACEVSCQIAAGMNEANEVSDYSGFASDDSDDYDERAQAKKGKYEYVDGADDDSGSDRTSSGNSGLTPAEPLELFRE